jgi:glycerate 2-kinase
MTKIKNKHQLIQNGKTELLRKAREIALDSMDYALTAVDPKKIVRSKLLLEDDILKIEKYSFNLAKFRNLYVIGGGKAAGSMAEAIEEILGKFITKGIINIPYGRTSETKVIRLNEARHPLPNKAGIIGTGQMLELAQNAGVNDLIICLTSGGGSSLMVYPRDGIDIEDKCKLTSALLRSGATINEINIVRKHLSSFKGGWLAKRAYPATVLNIILSDVVGDRLDVIASGPTVPDLSTFSDARIILEKYNLWVNSPLSIQKVIDEGERGVIEETPKAQNEVFKKVYNVIIGNNRSASLAICQYLGSKGFKTLLLTSTLEGEARCIGKALSSIANEIIVSGNPSSKPVAIIAGGETTVKVTGTGLGGRNQEFALSAALKLENNDDCAVVVACVGTDGVDGPTDAAGAVVDGFTCIRAKRLGLNAEHFLAENNSYNFFSNLGDLVFTGQTGTNVNDICIMIIL